MSTDTKSSPKELLDALPVAVIEIADNKVILQMNAMALQVLPFVPGDTLTWNGLCQDIEGSITNLDQQINEALANKTPIHGLAVALKLPIRTDWFQIHAKPIRRDQSFRMVMSLQNINRLKEQERLAARQRTELAEAARYKGINTLAGGLAHEINNPLTMLRGYTDVLRNKMVKGAIDKDVVEGDLYWIHKNTLRIGSIINTLQQFATESSEDTWEKRDIKSIVESALIFCRERLAKNQVKIIVSEIPEQALVECRWAQLVQSVYNIIINAFDAMRDSSTENKLIKVDFRETKNDFELDISDNGPGISDDIAAKVLLPFFTTKPPGSGMGLGLTVAYEYLAQHRGSLTYRKEGGHTVFKITLPKAISLLASA